MKRLPMWVWLIPVILLTVWFGARGLDIDPIKQDEFFQIRDVRTTNDPLAMAIHVAAENPWHVPAYFIMLNAWGRYFDWNPAPMRAAALLIGVLTIAWTYRLGQLISPRTGLYAAALISVSAFFNLFWHEVRMYTMTALMAALVLWLYQRVMYATRTPTRLHFAVLSLSAALALYTHYFLGLLLASLGLYHLLFAPKNRRWWRVSGSLAVAAVLFAPWLTVFFKVAARMRPGTVGGVLSNPDALAELLKDFSNGQIAAMLALGLLSGMAFWVVRRQRPLLGMMWFVLVGSVMLSLVANTVIGLLSDGRIRYLTFLWPVMATLGAAGVAFLGALPWRTRRIGAIVSASMVCLWLGVGVWDNVAVFTTPSVADYLPYFPVHKVFRELRPLHRPGDFIVQVLPDYDWAARYQRSIPFYPQIERLAADSQVLAWLTEPERQLEETRDLLGAIGAGRQYVWVAYPPDKHLSSLGDFEQALSRTYDYCGVAVDRPDFRVDEYAPSPVCCTPQSNQRTATAVYGDIVSLMGIELHVDQAADLLDWHISFAGGDQVPQGAYSIALHIIDAAGNLVAQADSGLPSEAFQCERQQLSLAGLESGDYDVRLGVYNWQTGERLTGVTSVTSGDMLTVASFGLAER